MRAREDLTGQTFNHLTFVKFSHMAGTATYWWVKCSCGVKKITRAPAVKSGMVVSCGHILGLHKKTHGLSKSRVYKIWNGMKTRCLNPENKDYKNYGGRGITVCESWLKFENFYAYVGDPPDGKTLDRYPNNDGNYEPGNVRWATPEQQALNRRDNVKIPEEHLQNFIENLGVSNRKLAAKFGVRHALIAKWRKLIGE